MLRYMVSAANRQRGDEVRRLMIDKGWTPEAMSMEILARYGVQFQTSARTIYRAMEGFKPSPRKQIAIAQVLDVLPSHLWDQRRKVAR